jgi:hypothetical protein
VARSPVSREAATKSRLRIAIVCAQINRAAASLETRAGLASLHRELAANVPLRGAGSGAAGTPADRNVELRVTPPFPLTGR